MKRRALLILIILCRCGDVVSAIANVDSATTCDEGKGDGRLTYNTTSKTAQRMAKDYKDFFEFGIREYDASSDERFKNLTTVALWHHAISKLDIPDEDDESASNLEKMIRLLSSFMVQISDAAYPDPSQPEDPNHDWMGRAGPGRWKRYKNRANHDSFNHMKQGALSLHFVHLMKEHRPDLWGRVLKVRGIEAEEDERLYLMNIFVAGYFFFTLRVDETEGWDSLYSISDDDKAKLKKYFYPEGSRPELQLNVETTRVANIWLFRALSQTDYYKSLLGKHADSMSIGFLLTNFVEGRFTDENGKACKGWSFLHDDNGNEYNLPTVADEVFAAHFEMAATVLGHFLDHIRVNYSHFTKPKGCAALWTRQMYKAFFQDDMMHRVKDSYSFWTYLNQQTLQSDSDRMIYKAPSDIKLEMGKPFFELNPWAKSIYKKWRHLAEYPAKEDAQRKFHALCQDFQQFFSLLFAKKNLHMHLDARTATFFHDLFRLPNDSFETIPCTGE